jgi:hypothetical protein
MMNPGVFILLQDTLRLWRGSVGLDSAVRCPQFKPRCAGVYSALRNPAGGFGFGTDWGTYALLGHEPADGAIRIEGTTGSGAIPEPATWSLLALGVGALAFLRRRK